MKYAEAFTCYRPIFVDITGDLVSGIMLSRIVYWHSPDKSDRSKLRVSLSGRYWLVKSREDWRWECGFTRNQYRGAVAKLKRLKFIDTEIHLFKNRTSVYIRLNLEKVEKALKKQITRVSKSLHQRGEFHPSGKVKITSPYNSSTDKMTAKGIPVTTSKDVLKDFESKKSEVVAQAIRNGKKGPDGLRREWVTLVPYFHDVGHTMLPLTKKEGGMLSAFSKRVGAARAPDLLLWAVREWTGRFAHQVLELHHTALPNQPHPAYLLKYADAALSGWSAGLTQKAIAPVQSIATQIVVKKFVVK